MLNGVLRALRPSRGTAEVLVDVDLATAIAFGIVFRTPPLYRDLLLRRGVDLATRSGNSGSLRPAPATFLVGQDGIVRCVWVNIDFTQRAEPAEDLAALHHLQTLCSA